MYDLTTGQRTFSLGVSGLGTQGLTQTADISFRDTAGNDIKCSYFKIDCAAQNSVNSAVIAEVSGIVATGNALLNEVSAIGTLDAMASGVVGVGVLCGSGGISTAEWHGSNGQVATGIRLVTTTDFTAGVSVMVTYGNLFGLSNQRINVSGTYDKGV